MNQDLIKYISDSVSSGMSPLDIKKNLLGAGWNESDIDSALKIYGNKAVDMPVFNPKKPGRNLLKPALLVGLPMLIIIAGLISFFTFKNLMFKAPTSLVKQNEIGANISPIVPEAGQITTNEMKNKPAVETLPAASGPNQAMPETLEIVKTGGLEFYRIGAQYEEAYNPFQINGKIGYFAKKADKEIIVYDGKEYGGGYDKVSKAIGVGGKLAFVASMDEKFRQHYLYLDGKVGELSKEYWGPVYLYSVGGKPAYIAGLKDKTDVLVVDGKEIGRYKSVIPAGRFDYDLIIDVGGKAAYSERIKVKEGTWEDVVYLDGKKIGQYSNVYDLKNIGGHLAFRAISGEFNNTKYRAILDGEFVGQNVYVKGDLVDLGGKLAFISEDNNIYIDGKPMGVQSDPKNLRAWNGELIFMSNGKIMKNNKVLNIGNDPADEFWIVNNKLFYRIQNDYNAYVFDGKKYLLPNGGILNNSNIGIGASYSGAKPVFVVWQDKKKKTIFDQRGVFIFGDSQPRCGWFDRIYDISTDESGAVYFLARKGDDVKAYDEKCNIKFTGPKPWPLGDIPSKLAIIGGKTVVKMADVTMYVDGKEYKPKGNFYNDIANPVDINGKVGFIFSDSEEGYMKNFIVYDGHEYGKEYANADNIFDFDGQLGYIALDKSGIQPKSFLIVGGQKIQNGYDYLDQPIGINGKLAYVVQEKTGELSSRAFIVYDNQELYKDRNYSSIVLLK